jgi:hypothetical protein
MFRSAIIQEKFLVINLKSLSSFDIAHKPTEEIRVKISVSNILENFFFVLASFFKLSISVP